MNAEKLRDACLADEELEYHLMGVERGADLMPAPGWYPCTIAWFCANGDVEICFTPPELDGLGCTVLKKNIPIAFRVKSEVRDAK